MYQITEIRKGLKIEVENVPYEVVDFLHHKPGRGGAFMRTKLRNLLTGRIQEITFRSGEKVDRPDIETREMQFLYREGEDLVFMDMESYEQTHIPAEQTDGKDAYLKDSQMVQILMYKGKPLDFEIPTSVVFEVTHTEPGLKGDTVSNVTKAAVVETGMTIQVPLFVNIGDKIKIDTRTGAYLSRE